MAGQKPPAVDSSGQPFVAGVYAMLQDETCFFLAADFDKEGWREDAAVFIETCRHRNLPSAGERSRSGREAHVWIFFDDAVLAALARMLGSLILTETMEQRPEIGCDSDEGEHGHVIFDECHHLSAHGFEQIARRAMRTSRGESRRC